MCTLQCSLLRALPKHDDLKQEINTLSLLRQLLSRHVVPVELEDVNKTVSVMDFIASEFIK